MDEVSEKPEYTHALIMYVLWRDTSPDGDDGLTIEEIEERCKTLKPDEYEHVDRIFMNLCEDWEELKKEAEE